MCIFGGGVGSQRTNIVATDWMLTDGPYPETKALMGGFTIVDVPSRRGDTGDTGVGCQVRRRRRCTQEVGEIMFDPLV